jgi:hypothetical protein
MDDHPGSKIDPETGRAWDDEEEPFDDEELAEIEANREDRFAFFDDGDADDVFGTRPS